MATSMLILKEAGKIICDVADFSLKNIYLCEGKCMADVFLT